MGWWFLWLALFDASAQWNVSWRVYKVSDGLSDSLCSAITVGPNGDVWVKHGPNDAISCLTGYDIINAPNIEEGNNRFFENRNSQLWTTYAGGVARMRGGHWVKFPNADIERENRTNFIRRVMTPVPLAPIYSQMTLIALPDRMICFDAGRPGFTVVKDAGEAALGNFTSLAAGREDFYWLAGTRGLARFRMAPSKNLTLWEEYPAPPEVENIQHLSVDDHGGITAVAEEKVTKTSMVVSYDNGRWETHKLLRDRIHYAWRGPENSLWACSIHNLMRIESGRAEIVERESQITGWINDVAVESKGVFWLATSEGLARYAPPTWRTPPEIMGPAEGASGIMQDSQKRIWFVSDSGLKQFFRGQWKNYPFTDSTETGFQPNDAVFTLPKGEVALRRGDKLLLFNPQTEQFAVTTHPQNRTLRLLGQLHDESLCLQTIDSNLPASSGAYRLETFDGKGFHVLAETNATHSLSGELFFCLETTNRDLWIGGAKGVGLWRNEKLQTFSHADGLVPETAYCMLEMGNGRVWCGGSSKIYEFDHQRWALIETGFDRINSLIRAQDGGIWAASNDGVYRYIQNSWLLNTTEDGLPSTAVYDVFQDDQGTIWAGTARGLSQLHSDSDIDPPRAVITSPNSQEIFPLETLVTLTLHGQDKWKYTAANRLLYSTRLDGEKWTPFNVQTTLPLRQSIPGKHRVEARVLDRNGNVDLLNPATFEFTVVLPWYLESRLIVTVSAGLIASLLLAGIAINRHLRLKKSYAQVELIVEQRTKELNQAHEALLHSQKMQALGALSAGIAHDFNNILSIVKGSVQIIEEHLDNKNRVLNRLDRIKTVVDQGASVVKAMLGYSRTQASEASACEINQVVEQTIELLGDRFLQGIELRRQLGVGLPIVFCIKDLLQQILLNLILNASEAMAGEGKITILTSVTKEFPPTAVLAPSAAAEFVTVAVQDAGCGINAEIRSRIFEPFFTTKALSTRRGTGLGLSMVYEFARTQGFGIHFESEVGRGSTFTIYLPVKPKQAAASSW